MNPRAQCRRPPPRRSRTRGLLKWSGTLACLLILLAAAACLRWSYLHFDGRKWSIHIASGSFTPTWSYGEELVYLDPAGLSLGTKDTRTEAADGFVRYALWPRPQAFLRITPAGDRFLLSEGRTASIPLRIPFVLIGLPTGWLWWRDRRRVPAGCCAACGYDLTGNVSGRCPECGALREMGTPKSEV